jgi:integrase
MVLVAASVGLRLSEIVGLKWGDFDFENLAVLVQRGVVHGRVGECKTEYSRDRLPVHPLLAKALLDYRSKLPLDSLCPPTAEGWIFANPKTGRPYHQEEIQKKHIRTAGISAGIGEGIGWHTFRHSYRSWLDENGEPMKVQQELMRHASIQTTMNVYGRVMADSKRKANGKVVEMVFGKSDFPVLGVCGSLALGVENA